MISTNSSGTRVSSFSPLFCYFSTSYPCSWLLIIPFASCPCLSVLSACFYCIRLHLLLLCFFQIPNRTHARCVLTSATVILGFSSYQMAPLVLSSLLVCLLLVRKRFSCFGGIAITPGDSFAGPSVKLKNSVFLAPVPLLAVRVHLLSVLLL